MPAQEKIEKLGIIAGRGDLPDQLVQACKAQDITPFVIGFEGQTQSASVHHWVTYNTVGCITGILKAQGIQDIVMIGGLNRPSFKDLSPSLKTFFLILKMGFKSVISSRGDDGLLRAFRREFESQGMALHGIHNFMPELLTPSGLIARHKPSKAQSMDIQKAIAVLGDLSAHDVGQALIIQQGQILGIEAAEGTDALIKRCGDYQRKGAGGILVKLSKTGQDKDLDLPTIGPNTLKYAAEAGLSGIALHAQNSLITNLEECIALADAQGIFLIGIETGKAKAAS